MDFRAHFSLVISLLCISCCSSGTYGDARVELQPSAAEALVTGAVYCETCFPQPPSKPAHFISGASVAIECGDDGAGALLYRKVVTTNRHGVFRARLPPKISKHARLIEACSVKLIQSSEPFCAVASSATTAGRLRLKSRSHGVHLYSAGFFTFKPLNQPELCYQKPKQPSAPLLQDQKAQEQQPGFFVPLPTISILPAPAGTGAGTQMPANPFFPPLMPTNPFFPPQSNALQPPSTASPTAGGAMLPANPFFPPQLPMNPFFPPQTNVLQPPPTAGGTLLPRNPFFPPQSNALQPPSTASPTAGGTLLPANPFFPPQLPMNPFFPPQTNALQPPPTAGGTLLPRNPFFPPQSNPLQPLPTNQPPPSSSSAIGGVQLPPRIYLPRPPRLGLPSFPRLQPPSTSQGALPSPPARSPFMPFPSTNPLFPFPRFPGAPPALSAAKASP